MFRGGNFLPSRNIFFFIHIICFHVFFFQPIFASEKKEKVVMKQKSKNIADIFQKVEASALLSRPNENMGGEEVWFTGSVKYPIDLMEDCAQICNGEVEDCDDIFRLSKGSVTALFDRKRQVVYVNEKALKLVEENKKSITFYLK